MLHSLETGGAGGDPESRTHGPVSMYRGHHLIFPDRCHIRRRHGRVHTRRHRDIILHGDSGFGDVDVRDDVKLVPVDHVQFQDLTYLLDDRVGPPLGLRGEKDEVEEAVREIVVDGEVDLPAERSQPMSHGDGVV